MNVSNLSDVLKLFWIHSTVSALKKSLKNANVLGFLPLKEILVAMLSETCALSFRTNVAEKCMTIPILSETL